MLGNEANSIELEADPGPGPQGIDWMEGQSLWADDRRRTVTNRVLEYGQVLLGDSSFFE